MSVESMSWALRVQDLLPTEKLVLIGICNHDGDGGAWPSIATLSMYAATSTRTVQRAIAALVEHGYVTVDTNAGGTMQTRNDRRPNHYVVHRPRHGATPTSPRESNGVTPVTERDDTAMSPEPSLNRPTTLAQPPLSASELEGDSAHFETFWTIWPKKMGKGAARKAFSRATRRADPATIIAGAERISREWDAMPAVEHKYVPYPERWLNADRWLDQTFDELLTKPAVPHWEADADCLDCGGDGWLPLEEGSNDVVRCACAVLR